MRQSQGTVRVGSPWKKLRQTIARSVGASTGSDCAPNFHNAPRRIVWLTGKCQSGYARHMNDIEYEVFPELAKRDHEQVILCRDEVSGLRAIIGIHNTV